MTPQGTLKVLVIFAGLTNDIDIGAPFYYDGANNPWPQEDGGVHPAGLTLPKNPTKDFYTNSTSFQPNAADRSLSNFYYQMSRHSANPFKMQAVVFPKRINVTATATVNSGGGFYQYTADVLAALKNDPDTRNFDFSQVDQRGGTPNFQYDNSAPGADNVIDYTVIIWRNTGAVHGIGPATYGGNGWASAGFMTNIPSANGQLYRIGPGFT